MTLVDIRLRWDDRHGRCYDCGFPVAYVCEQCGEEKFCSICAAQHAASGDTIRHIDTEV